MADEITLHDNQELVTSIHEQARVAGKILHELDKETVTKAIPDDVYNDLTDVLKDAQDDYITTADIYSPLAEHYSRISKAKRDLDDQDISPSEKEALSEAFEHILRLYTLSKQAFNA